MTTVKTTEGHVLVCACGPGVATPFSREILSQFKFTDRQAQGNSTSRGDTRSIVHLGRLAPCGIVRVGASRKFIHVGWQPGSSGGHFDLRSNVRGGGGGPLTRVLNTECSNRSGGREGGRHSGAGEGATHRLGKPEQDLLEGGSGGSTPSAPPGTGYPPTPPCRSALLVFYFPTHTPSGV